MVGIQMLMYGGVFRKCKTMINKLFILLVLMLALQVAGCPLSKEKMRKVFSEDIRMTLGKSLEDLTCCRGRFLYGREPTEIKTVENGNLLYIYRDYWGPYVKRTGRCDVFMEFTRGEQKTVIKAWSEGSGCYRAY